MTVNSRVTVMVFALAAGTSVGCIDSEAPPAATPVAVREPLLPAEEAWDEQVAAVRQGDRNQISFKQRPVSPAEWEMLADGCEQLEVMEVDCRLLTADHLAQLAVLPNLRQVVLMGPVDDAGIASLASSRSIKVLNLPNSALTDDGLAALSELPELELLRFSSPNVTDAGIEAIARLPSLRFLHLIDVPITDAGLVHLYGLHDLESFYLDGGRCTDAGLQTLLNELPDLHFHRDQLHLPGDRHAHPHE